MCAHGNLVIRTSNSRSWTFKGPPGSSGSVATPFLRSGRGCTLKGCLDVMSSVNVFNGGRLNISRSASWSMKGKNRFQQTAKKKWPTSTLRRAALRRLRLSATTRPKAHGPRSMASKHVGDPSSPRLLFARGGLMQRS